MLSDQPQSQSGSKDHVTRLFRDLLAAWNARDPRTYAGLFASDGNVVGFDGSQMDGPETIARNLESIFESHQTASYVAHVREVRLLAPGVAVLRAVAGMVPPGKTEINPAVNAIEALVAVNGENGWRIAQLCLHTSTIAQTMIGESLLTSLLREHQHAPCLAVSVVPSCAHLTIPIIQ